jgi:uncharacterized protein YcfL
MARLFAPFVFFFLLVSCSSTPTIKELTIRMGDTENIEIVDMRSIVRNGILTVQATIKNTKDNSLVSYRFNWFNKNGLKVIEDEAWKPLTIPKDHTREVIGIAPTADVSDFKLELSSYK